MQDVYNASTYAIQVYTCQDSVHMCVLSQRGDGTGLYARMGRVCITTIATPRALICIKRTHRLAARRRSMLL